MGRRETLRLLVYQKDYWPLFGGYAHHLRYRLRLMPRHGIEPWVLTRRMADLPEEEVVDNVLVRRVRIPAALNRRAIFSEMAFFPEFFRSRDRYDLALMSSSNVAGAFIRDICRRPVIRESVIGDDHASKFTHDLSGRAKEFFFRRVDFAVVISPALEKGYQIIGWKKNRMRLIPRGVDSEIFCPAGSDAEIDRLRCDLGLPPRSSPLFLTVGAVRERKGHLDLVEVWRILPPRVPPAHLIIVGPVGDEEYHQSLMRRVAELGLGDRIHLQGRSERIADYMRCVDGFVFASHNEGFPNSIIEAMSSGLPVAAFDIEGILPFILQEEKDGIIVPGRDREVLARAIERLAGNPELRAGLGRAARAKAMAKFSLQKEAEAHARLYWAIHRYHQRQGRS